MGTRHLGVRDLPCVPLEVADHLRVFDMTDPHTGTQWDPGYFDVATCFETMEHIPHVMDEGNGRYPTVNAIVHMRDNL